MAAANNVKGPKSDKVLRDALLIAVNREDLVDGKPTKRITQIAEKVSLLAAAGEAWAVREVWDRIEGKPTQEATITHEGELTVQSAPVSAVNSFFAEAFGHRESVSDKGTLPN